MAAVSTIKLSCTIHSFLVSGKKLRNIKSKKEVAMANTKNMRVMVTLQWVYMLPIIFAPFIKI